MKKVDREEYYFEGMTFSRYYDSKERRYRFFRDEEEITLTRWLRATNKYQPMEKRESHPNPLIRLIESNRKRMIYKLVRPKEGDVIADIGCEAGYISERLLEKVAKGYFIDIDLDLLRLAQNRLKGKRVSLLQADVLKIPLSDNSVHTAICTQVLEHLPEPELAIEELIRITKPKGKIVLSVPNDNLILLIKKWLRKLHLSFFFAGLSLGLPMGHLHIFTKESLSYLWRDKNIKEEKVQYNFPFYTNLYALLNPIK